MQGDSVDALCWRFYGRTEGMVELVLEKNQDLAKLGHELPIGTIVDLPDEPPQAKAQLIQLWD